MSIVTRQIESTVTRTTDVIFTICNVCGAEIDQTEAYNGGVIALPNGWMVIDRLPPDYIPRHFCGWACLAEHAAEQAVPASRRSKKKEA